MKQITPDNSSLRTLLGEQGIPLCHPAINVALFLLVSLTGCSSASPEAKSTSATATPNPQLVSTSSTAAPTAVRTNTEAGCKSLHLGTGIPIAETQQLEVVAPVGNSFTTVVVATNSDRLGLSFLTRDEHGWHSNETNQLVVFQQEGNNRIKVDLSPNLRIFKGHRRLLVIQVPLNNFDGMSLRPVVSTQKNVAGSIHKYEAVIAANGVDSLFQPLEQPLSPGQPLASELSQLLDKTNPGDLLIPDRFASDMSVQPITGANLNLCPLSQ